MKRPPFVQICICGHPDLRHTLIETEHCRCERTDCNCVGGFRPMVVVPFEYMKNFRNKPRGSLTPHPLTQGIEVSRLEDVDVQWVAPPQCDVCHFKAPSDLNLTVYVVGEDGFPLRPVKDGGSGSRVDSGRHVVLCAECDEIDLARSKRLAAAREAELAQEFKDAMNQQWKPTDPFREIWK